MLTEDEWSVLEDAAGQISGWVLTHPTGAERRTSKLAQSALRKIRDMEATIESLTAELARCRQARGA